MFLGKERRMKDYREIKLRTVSDLVSDAPVPQYYRAEEGNGNELKMLSLFSGCGGMDIGFEGGFICHKQSLAECCDWKEADINSNWVLLKKNQFKTVFANDILAEARKTWLKYMERFGVNSDTYRFSSIVDLVKMHREGEKVFPDDVDIVTGGFPCQDFSVSGKRKGFNSDKSHDGKKVYSDQVSEETRGRLYYWMKQVIDIVKPKIFIAENVKGLVSLGDVKDIIQRDFASADGNDYIVLTPKVLDAGNYGVPETRERVIFIGIRKSALNEKARKILEQEVVPEDYSPYPPPTHNHSANNDKLRRPVVCKDIFEGLLEPENTCDLSQRFYSQAKYMGKHCQGQSEININGLAPTIRSEHHGNIEYRRLSVEHGGKNYDELGRGLAERRLTPRECALIQTFPPDYPFVHYKGYTKKYDVSPSSAYKVIGNAVPPMLAYNLARRIQNLWNVYFG